MQRRKILLFPQHQRMLAEMGLQFKLARKRRRFTAQMVAERAGINRTTVHEIEKGSGSVSMAAYFNVLRVLGLHEDILKLAADDILGRKLQDIETLGERS